ncbi:hypothetical protein V8G54_027212 [Vigna mungo]|uniref:Uncharacterized protein n=1 Tax=Vigna mungo TaxID=3915 RepID=A0AAQ3RQ82_VIGMU
MVELDVDQQILLFRCFGQIHAETKIISYKKPKFEYEQIDKVESNNTSNSKERVCSYRIDIMRRNKQISQFIVNIFHQAKSISVTEALGLAKKTSCERLIILNLVKKIKRRK